MVLRSRNPFGFMQLHFSVTRCSRAPAARRSGGPGDPSGPIAKLLQSPVVQIDMRSKITASGKKGQNIFVAGVAGVAIPLLLDRLDQDPAVASSIFVTMTTDSMGFLAFLGLAVLSGLTSL